MRPAPRFAGSSNRSSHHSRNLFLILLAAFVGAVVVAPALGGEPIAPDPEKRIYARVKLTSAAFAGGRVQDVRVVDVKEDARKSDVEDALELLVRGEYDLIRFVSVVPRGACDSLPECADAVSETCSLLGETGATAELEQNGPTTQNCVGTCSTGRSVTIDCHPRFPTRQPIALSESTD